MATWAFTAELPPTPLPRKYNLGACPSTHTALSAGYIRPGSPSATNKLLPRIESGVCADV